MGLNKPDLFLWLNTPLQFPDLRIRTFCVFPISKNMIHAYYMYLLMMCMRICRSLKCTSIWTMMVKGEVHPT
ncbi:hypothetical protein Hdeb2414_s0001g00007831 [Helianthus debilis subsp. tardiflorus]